MKLSNRQLVPFVNLSGGPGSILTKKIPRKLYSAISQNMTAVDSMAKTFIKQRSEVSDDDIEGITELLDITSEVVIQTVPESIFDMMDASDKFDSLTGSEYAALEFMIEKPEE